MTETPDPIDIDIAARLKAAREAKGLTQAKLGQAIGVSFQQVQKYERGVNRVSASALVKCAAALDVSVGALCGEDGVAPQALPILHALSALRPDQRQAVLAVVRAMSSG